MKVRNLMYNEVEHTFKADTDCWRQTSSIVQIAIPVNGNCPDRVDSANHVFHIYVNVHAHGIQQFSNRYSMQVIQKYHIVNNSVLAIHMYVYLWGRSQLKSGGLFSRMERVLRLLKTADGRFREKTPRKCIASYS